MHVYVVFFLKYLKVKVTILVDPSRHKKYVKAQEIQECG